jgi:hypothetical protein
METQFLGLIFTNHAIQRLYERGIAQSDAWYTFQHADKKVPGSSPGAYKFYKDYGEQRIEVIAKKNEKGEWVILSCWSKFVGTGKPLFQKPENFFVFSAKKVFRKLRRVSALSLLVTSLRIVSEFQ